MLALEKIIASLIMPPGLFVLILFILTVYLFKKSESKLIKLLALFMRGFSCCFIRWKTMQRKYQLMLLKDIQ
jgi:hypothetical protein